MLHKPVDCGSMLLLVLYLSRWSSESKWWANGLQSNRTWLLLVFYLVGDSLVLLSKVLEVEVYTVIV